MTSALPNPEGSSPPDRAKSESDATFATSQGPGKAGSEPSKHGRSPTSQRLGSVAKPEQKFISQWSEIWLIRQLQAAYASHPKTASELIERAGIPRKRFYDIIVHAKSNPTVPVLIKLVSALDLTLRLVSWEKIMTEGMEDEPNASGYPLLDDPEDPTDPAT